MKTLIIDDYELDRVALELILEDHAECTLVEGGKDAVQAFADAWKAKEPFDLICLDLQMPEMDGFEVLTLLRKMEKEMNLDEDEQSTIIVVSGQTDRASKVRCDELGCDSFLLKPLNKGSILLRLKLLGLMGNV